MKSKLYKVLHPVCGKPMVEHVVDHISNIRIEKIVTIVGHGAEKVQEQLGDRSEYVFKQNNLEQHMLFYRLKIYLGNLKEQQ